MKRNFVGLIFILCLSLPLFSQEDEINKKSIQAYDPKNYSLNTELKILRKSYPDCTFELNYDEEVDDFTITVTAENKTTVFYWCKGLYLPKSQLDSKEHYWRVIVPYNREPIDPAKMTKEQIEKIRSFGSTENRKKGRVSSKALFEAIYDSHTFKDTEPKIVNNITFLGKKTRIHRSVLPALRRVEKKIYSLAKTDKETKNFLDNLASADAYYWREIRDSNTRSFHSFGIAIDVLPKGWSKKIIYWGFEKNNGNKDWMLIPLEKRWSPPKKVIRAFESEGFIWGGNWAIWDNMHFEYHPEQIATLDLIPFTEH